MSLHSDHHIHHFLRNKEMNELYVSYGILNFSLGLISVFVPIYLFKLGYSIPWILFYFFLISLGFVFFSFIGVQIVSKYGVKHSMLIAMPILIVYFFGLRFLPTFPVLFFILPILKSFKMMLYNYSFHLNFIEHSNEKDRGKEVSMVKASALIAGVLSPLFGGVIIKFFGFPSLFIIGSVLLLTAMIPLFITKDNYESITFNKEGLIRDMFKKENLPIFYSFFGYAIESWIGMVVWPIFIFIILTTTESVGAVVSLSTLLTLVVFYFVGKETDKGNKRKLIKIGTILYFFGWVGRLFVQTFISIFFIDTYKNFARDTLHVPWSAYLYDIAAKRDYFKFIVQREVAFNLSRTVATPLFIAVFVIGYHPFIITFSIAALSSLLYVFIVKA